MRVFVSSAMHDTAEFRKAAERAIADAGHQPVLIENTAVSGTSFQQLVANTIHESEALVAIIGPRIGSLEPQSMRPWVAFETGIASSSGKPTFVYVVRSPAVDSEENLVLRHFLGNIARTPFVKVVESAEDLARNVYADLTSFSASGGTSNEKQQIVIPAIDPRDIATLLSNPEELKRCPSRYLEELVADLLAADGWVVELVARNNAPGPDIIAVSTKVIEHVPLKLIVECKRHSDENPVDIDVVRKVMYWVNEDYRATLGMIATTSRFTSAAIQQAERYHQWRLDLRDYAALIAWIQKRYRNTQSVA